MKYLDENGLLYFWQKIVNKFVQKDGTKVLSSNDFTDAYKTKLEGIATGATKVTVDTALSASSTNPVQNKAINTALGGKVDKENGKGLSSNDFTDALLTKLNGIATGANKTTVDSSLSTTSANPVQNKVINTALGTKVDKEEGKGLSANDFTDALKTKLEGIAEGATKVTLDTATSTSSTNGITNKAVTTALNAKAALASPTFTGTPKAPTAAAGTNTTQIATTAFVKTAVDTAIGSVTQISYEVVDALPSTGVVGKIYLVAHSHGASDIYDEYIWVNSTSKFEKIGNTDIDLSNYVQRTEMEAITNAEIDTIVAA